MKAAAARVLSRVLMCHRPRLQGRQHAATGAVCHRHRWRFLGGGVPRWSVDEVCLVCKKRRTRMMHPDECFGMSLFVGYKPKTAKWLERNRYRCVEPGVRDAVRTLTRAGIQTVWSCDGDAPIVQTALGRKLVQILNRHGRGSVRRGVPCIVCVGFETDRKRARELVGGQVATATHTNRLFKPLLPEGTFYIRWSRRKR